MSSPSVVYRTLAVSRAGAEEVEYEDAAAVATEGWPVCAAVADGATESVFAQRWARCLVRGLVEQEGVTSEVLRDAISEWQSEWQATVRDNPEEQPWYVTAKAAEGAFAALLGLSLHADGQWRAVSIGDCCLFHIRDGALVQSWPFEAPDAFTNRPALVPSRAAQAVPLPETMTGTWRPEDTFLLATDAVAAWLLTSVHSEDPGRPGPAGAGDWEQETFQTAVEKARAEGNLRNDDATLLVVHLDEESNANRCALANPSPDE